MKARFDWLVVIGFFIGIAVGWITHVLTSDEYGDEGWSHREKRFV